jgi:uncharacterized membrane protein
MFLTQLLLSITFAKEISLGDFHPALIHFPIVMFCLGLVFDVLYLRGKTWAYPIGHWMVIAAAVLAIPTVIAGLSAAGSHTGHAGEALSMHKLLALTTLAFGAIHAFLRIYILRREKMMFKFLLVGASLFSVSLVGATAEYGGVVVRGKAILLASDNPQESHHHQPATIINTSAKDDDADGHEHSHRSDENTDHEDESKKDSNKKVKYYRSTMMPNETSQTPAKDSMGMDMEPVYEGSKEQKS